LDIYCLVKHKEGFVMHIKVYDPKTKRVIVLVSEDVVLAICPDTPEDVKLLRGLPGQEYNAVVGPEGLDEEAKAAFKREEQEWMLLNTRSNMEH
jgi:hypothetical protein